MGYEVLSDPAQRPQYDVPPEKGKPGGQAPPGGHSQPGSGAGQSSHRDFTMDEAAEIFRNAFGTTSEEYSDLIQHLMSSSSTGNKVQWEKHAAEIARALKSNGGNDMDVETAAPDGSSRIRTSRTVHDNGRGTVTKTTRTE